MRTTIAALLLAVSLTACTRTNEANRPGPVTLSIHPVTSAASPSPFVEVRVGSVRALIPRSWQARMLPASELAQEGFVASPQIDAWFHGRGVPGIEAFWVDGNQLPIPSDYYYLAARNASFGALGTPCTLGHQQVFANHPPDLTGITYSPGDYVVGAQGVCQRPQGLTRWAYVVAAPGFGPERQVGIPSSGLYVVLAEASGPNSARLLHEMMDGARFGGTTITEIVQAAGRPAAAL
ncbi:MAG TPA: hypothetical protein VGH10_07100 [Actinomycetota bacterium]